MDDFSKELLILEPARTLGSSEVIQLLEDQIFLAGKPAKLRTDNGSEFTSRRFLSWSHDQKIDHFLIQPGKPMQNGMVESLNGKIRDEFLNEAWFLSVQDAKALSQEFKDHYNNQREHSSLGRLTPAEFKMKMTQTLYQHVG